MKSATNNYLQRQPKAKPLRVRTVARVSAPMLCFEKWGQKGDGTAPLPAAAALRVKGCKLEYLKLSDFMLLLSFRLLGEREMLFSNTLSFQSGGSKRFQLCVGLLITLRGILPTQF